MGTPFLGEVKIMSFNFAPQGWAMCNGQLLPINQNQALFSLLGTSYGGNGQTTFALPDLRGNASVHVGQGHTQGEKGGEQAHTLTLSEMPLHTHVANASSSDGAVAIPTGNFLARSASALYIQPGNLTPMSAGTVSNVGGSQAHQNMQPFLVLTFCIALIGVFPSQN